MGQEQMAINAHSKTMKMMVGNLENSKLENISINVCSFNMYRPIYKYIPIYVCIYTYTHTHTEL